MWKHLGPLVILPKGSRINQTRYTEEVLKPHFVPFYKKMVRKYGKEVVMQEDGGEISLCKEANYLPGSSQGQEACVGWFKSRTSGVQ